MKLKEMLEEKAKLKAQMEAYIDEATSPDFEVTEEGEANYEAMESKLDNLVRQIERSAKLTSTPDFSSVGQMQNLGSTALERVQAPEAKREFDRVEEWFAAAANARLGGPVDQRLTWVEQKAEQTMGVGAEGGFLIPNHHRSEILSVDPAETPLLSMVTRWGAMPGQPDASVIQPALDQTGNQHGGATVGRIGEGGVKPETDIRFRELTWTPQELAAHVPMTEKVLRNAAALEGRVIQSLRGALNSAIENEIVRGVGGLQFSGILGHPSAINVNRAVADQFNYADAATMYSTMLKRGGGGAWFVNTTLQSDVITMQDAGGNSVWMPSAVPGTPSTLMGLPVYWYEYSAVRGALGDVMLLKPSYYVVQDGSGPFVDFGRINDDFVSNRVRVKIFTNNDGQPWLTQPFTLANGVDTASPFVILDVP